MKIYPKGVTPPEKGKPLKITKAIRAEMIAKAKTYVPQSGIEENDLFKELESFYCASNKHYTSEQLKDIVDEVREEFAPDPKPIEAPKI